MTLLPATDHRTNQFLAALDGKAFSLLERDLRHVSLPGGAVLYQAGDVIDRLYFPQTALISLVVSTEGGRAIQTESIGREGAFGLHCATGQRRAFSDSALQIGGTLSVIRASRFSEVARESAAIRDLVERYYEISLAAAQQNIACNGLHDAPSRLCRWLLQLADQTGQDRLAITHQMLARLLGVQRTTVTLIALKLQEKGLIRNRRAEIEILDRQHLEAMACECRHALSRVQSEMSSP